MAWDQSNRLLLDPHGLKPPHTFAALVEYLMKEKSSVDRRAYSIVSEGQPYNAAAIKNIYHCRSRTFHLAGIRAVKQNQGIISRDVRDALPAWDVLRQPVQAATPA
jgi:hypothetical protein